MSTPPEWFVLQMTHKIHLKQKLKQNKTKTVFVKWNKQTKNCSILFLPSLVQKGLQSRWGACLLNETRAIASCALEGSTFLHMRGISIKEGNIKEINVGLVFIFVSTVLTSQIYLFKLFYGCSITVVCIFPPPLPTPPQTIPPPSLASTLPLVLPMCRL